MWRMQISSRLPRLLHETRQFLTHWRWCLHFVEGNLAGVCSGYDRTMAISSSWLSDPPVFHIQGYIQVVESLSNDDKQTETEQPELARDCDRSTKAIDTRSQSADGSKTRHLLHKAPES